MFTIEDADKIFERLTDMERKHWRYYWEAVEMMRAEKNATRAESIRRMAMSDQDAAEALQFAQGLIMEMMKRRNLWAGSRAEACNTAKRKWVQAQFDKHHGGKNE